MPNAGSRLAVGETVIQLPNVEALDAAAKGLRVSAQRQFGDTGHYCDDPGKESMRAMDPVALCEACLLEAAARAIDGLMIWFESGRNHLPGPEVDFPLGYRNYPLHAMSDLETTLYQSALNLKAASDHAKRDGVPEDKQQMLDGALAQVTHVMEWESKRSSAEAESLRARMGWRREMIARGEDPDNSNGTGSPSAAGIEADLNSAINHVASAYDAASRLDGSEDTREAIKNALGQLGLMRGKMGGMNE